MNSSATKGFGSERTCFGNAYPSVVIICKGIEKCGKGSVTLEEVREIRCSACDCMEEISVKCYCNHADAKIAMEIVGRRSAGKLIYLAPRRNGEIAIKTSPMWCPKRLLNNPIEITKPQAYAIISNGRPYGQFYLQEGKFITGISNLDGKIEVDEFGTVRACKSWLTKRRNHVTQDA